MVVTELLQGMIRNACVNDGTPDSGQEVRNADLLAAHLEGPGLDLVTYEPHPGRRSLVARIEGSDPTAPSVCLMGHTDVVPVTPEGWRHDPFGGELIDGEVWGRGAVDMLDLTSSMAVAVRELADSGFRPRGDVVFFAVADEEATGGLGAEWMLEHHWDAVGADYVLTENGGLVHDGPTGRVVTMNVAEKGPAWRRLTVRGTPGHGSMPFGADNALVKAAEVVRRLAEHRPAARLDDLWESFVHRLGLPPELAEGLLDADRVHDTIAAVGGGGAARFLHACTHMTLSPNVIHGGQKTNVIPDKVELEVDIRTLPGQDGQAVSDELRAALGDLADEVEVEVLSEFPANRSPVDTELWEALDRAVRSTYADARIEPGLLVGVTDARFYRARGATAYGAGLLSPHVSASDFASRFHGNDERIDLESLALLPEFWRRVVVDVCG